MTNGNPSRRKILHLGASASILHLQSQGADGTRRGGSFSNAIGQWANGSESAMHIALVRELWGRLEPHPQGAVYVNHISDDDRPEKVRASFGENLPRLRQIKGIYDKTNLFRVNSNISPA
jgi:hypothetical protein